MHEPGAQVEVGPLQRDHVVHRHDHRRRAHQRRPVDRERVVHVGTQAQQVEREQACSATSTARPGAAGDAACADCRVRARGRPGGEAPELEQLATPVLGDLGRAAPASDPAYRPSPWARMPSWSSGRASTVTVGVRRAKPS